MNGAPRSLVELVGSLLAPLRDMLRPGYWPAWRRSLRVAWPLASRFLRRYLLRNVLVALSVALALASFLLLSSLQVSVGTGLRAQTRQLQLPADAVALLPAPLESPEHQVPLRIRELQPLWVLDAHSRWGVTSVAGVPDAVLEDLQLLSGQLPRSPGQAAVEASTAARAGISPGDVVELRVAGQLAPLHITGVTTPSQFVLDGLITNWEGAASLAAHPDAHGNAYLIWGFEGRVDAAALRRWFPQGSRVVTRDLPLESLGGLLGRAHGPENAFILAIYVFSGLGVLNVMLLSYLQRRRYLGLLKAQGVRGHEAALMLLTEGAVMALGGVVVGAAGAAGIIHLVNQFSPLHLLFSWRALPFAALLGLLVFYLAAAGPAAMCRRASIHQLLYQRNIL